MARAVADPRLGHLQTLMRVGMGDGFSGMESLLLRRRAILWSHVRACRIPKRGTRAAAFSCARSSQSTRRALLRTHDRSCRNPKHGDCFQHRDTRAARAVCADVDLG